MNLKTDLKNNINCNYHTSLPRKQVAKRKYIMYTLNIIIYLLHMTKV